MNQPRDFKAKEYCDPNYGPMIEVLVDGRNWRSVFGWDEHFQFGLTKAKMVLATLPIIEEFCDYDGRRPPLGRKIRIFGDDTYGVMSECIRYDQFKTSFGSTVNKPYLKLIGKNKDYGFGIQKAEALLWLEPEIRQFIENNS